MSTFPAQTREADLQGRDGTTNSIIQVEDRISEGSWAGRVVAILTPFFALAAGWLAGAAAKVVPGVSLDKNQIVAFMVAVTTAGLGAGYKWLAGWQDHEQRVAAGRAVPRKPARKTRPTELEREEQGRIESLSRT